MFLAARRPHYNFYLGYDLARKQLFPTTNVREAMPFIFKTIGDNKDYHHMIPGHIYNTTFRLNAKITTQHYVSLYDNLVLTLFINKQKNQYEIMNLACDSYRNNNQYIEYIPFDLYPPVTMLERLFADGIVVSDFQVNVQEGLNLFNNKQVQEFVKLVYRGQQPKFELNSGTNNSIVAKDERLYCTILQEDPSCLKSKIYFAIFPQEEYYLVNVNHLPTKEKETCADAWI